MDENKTIVQEKGKQVLEFLAIKSLKDVKWAMGLKYALHVLLCWMYKWSY